MKLYKCEAFDETKCKDFKECMCRYTFYPQHIWLDHPETIELERAGAPIPCDSTGCPADTDEVSMLPYKEEK